MVCTLKFINKLFFKKRTEEEYKQGQVYLSQFDSEISAPDYPVSEDPNPSKVEWESLATKVGPTLEFILRKFNSNIAVEKENIFSLVCHNS